MIPELARLSPRVLLCDADGCLFPSEEPAYDASATVTNELLAELGVRRRYTAQELRLGFTGRNFRTTIPLICREHGVAVAPDVLERWVGVEARAVTDHLGRELRTDPAVVEPLRRLATTCELAVVSSSAEVRVRTCLESTGLSALVPPDRLFSAEDSLPEPVSKPDPAVYRWAGDRVGVSGEAALAVEDSAVGVQAAVAAGFPVVGLLQFVPAEETDRRAEALLDAGATALVRSWTELAEALLGSVQVVG